MNGGRVYNAIAANGWVGTSMNPLDGSVTLMDCNGNWATVEYKLNVTQDEPQNFRVCNSTDVSSFTCPQPAHIHVVCQGTSNGQNTLSVILPPNGFTGVFWGNPPDAYSGRWDTDSVTGSRCGLETCYPTYAYPNDLDCAGYMTFANDVSDGQSYSSCSGS